MTVRGSRLTPVERLTIAEARSARALCHPPDDLEPGAPWRCPECGSRWVGKLIDDDPDGCAHELVERHPDGTVLCLGACGERLLGGDLDRGADVRMLGGRS